MTSMDKLSLYKNCWLPVSGIHHMTFDTAYQEAQKRQRLPQEAEAVLQEIKKELASVIYETSIQKRERLDREFEALAQGQCAYAEFKARWRNVLEDMREAEIQSANNDEHLYRAYVRKIDESLRKAVFDKMHNFGTETAPILREPNTWEEVDRCCIKELLQRADSRAPAADSYLAWQQDSRPSQSSSRRSRSQGPASSRRNMPGTRDTMFSLDENNPGYAIGGAAVGAGGASPPGPEHGAEGLLL